MEVTLEKIELVKDRTGVSYKEAKDALEAADGSVVDAIIAIEDTLDGVEKKNVSEQSAAILENVNELVKKGNVAKIVVRKSDGEVLLNLPVTAGLLAAIVAPWGVLAGVLTSFAFKCVVEVVKDDGTVIDVSERANDVAGKAVEKGSDIADIAKQKAGEVYDTVKSNEKLGNIVDKAEDVIGDAADAIKGKIKNAEGSVKDVVDDTLDNINNWSEELAAKAEDVAEDVEEVKDAAEKAVCEAKDEACECKDEACECKDEACECEEKADEE